MWRSFARLLTQFDRNKLEPAIALRNAVGVFVPLAIGVAMGMPLGGVAVATGALQVALVPVARVDHPVLDDADRPIASFLLPGNTADVTMLLPVVGRLRARFGIDRACIVDEGSPCRSSSRARRARPNSPCMSGR